MCIRNSLLSIALIALVTSCGGTEKKATAPSSAAAPASTQNDSAVNSKPDDNPTRGVVNVASDVKKACGLSGNDAYFAFDSASVRPEDKKALRALADCFMSGPLKGRQMSLTGHADPRGSEDYNLALGGRRADNVKAIIVTENMIESKVSTTSRGAMDATGTNEASWAKDRSVDVNLGK